MAFKIYVTAEYAREFKTLKLTSSFKEFLIGCNMATESHSKLPRRRVLPVIKVFQP